MLRSLIPNTSRRAPAAILTTAEAKSVTATIASKKEILNVKGAAHFSEGIEMLTEPGHLRKAMKIFDECSNAYRNELYLSTDSNALRRLGLHESLMATGYYSRAANMHNPKLDAVRFVVNHYNFDIRGDSHLVDRCRRAILTTEEISSDDEILVGQVLQLERFLFGAQRLRPVEGKQYLLLGVPLTEFKDEKMLAAAMELPNVKAHGNFVVEHTEDVRSMYKGNTRRSTALQERWMAAKISCAEEPLPATTSTNDSSSTAVSIVNNAAVFSTDLMELNKETWLARKFDYSLRYLLPAPILPFMERVKMFLLNAWIYFFGGWVLFWMFDEELIAIVSIAYTRYHSKKILRDEAKITGGRIYMMQSKYH